MRETSAKTVTRGQYFSHYNEATVGADSQIADTTQLLLAWAGGDAAALDALAPRIYRELHRLAADFMKREREEPILQATALVHEVYLKLIDVQNVALDGKAHFFAICAQMMRRILVDAARKRAASRHGGGLGRIHLDDVAHLNLSQENDKQLIALDDDKRRVLGAPSTKRAWLDETLRVSRLNRRRPAGQGNSAGDTRCRKRVAFL